LRNSEKKEVKTIGHKKAVEVFLLGADGGGVHNKLWITTGREGGYGGWRKSAGGRCKGGVAEPQVEVVWGTVLDMGMRRLQGALGGRWGGWGRGAE